jgi:hypothetical protein
MKRRLRLVLFVLATAVTLSLYAVQMDPLSIEELAQQSTLVLHGTVLSKTCLRDPAGRIYTKVELDVAEVWKGTLSTNRFTIVHGGGILGEERAVVSGQVEYDVGEEVVTFLVLNQRGEGVTRGLTQGKFHVGKDPNERLVHNPFHGRPETAAKASLASDKQRLTLSELKRRVQGDVR